MDRADLFASARQLMVDGQIRPNKVYEPRLLDALRRLPRERFVPPACTARAYADEDVPLGGGRYLTEPMVIARLVQLAMVRPGERALVAASGTGYAAALLDACGAEVIAVEDDPALLELARPALAATAPQVRLQVGPPAQGWARAAPYDVIVIDGAVEEVPDPLVRQLRPMTMSGGGRLVAAHRTGRVTLGVLGEALGGVLRITPAFNCATPVLPAFRRSPSFVF
jgi:protein-L-isoaspartate(D-aspartate) O-methyltransferase